MIGSVSLDLSAPDSGDEFETLVADLISADFEVSTFRNGRSGQADDGVDIFFTTDAGEQIGVQCKRTDSLSMRTVRDEIEKATAFTPTLDRYLIVTSAPQDADLQEKVRTFRAEDGDTVPFEVELRMWDDVKRLLSNHREVFQTYYGEYTAQPESPLHSEGVIEITGAYFDDHAPRDPHTAWQSAFTLAEIKAGYGIRTTAGA